MKEKNIDSIQEEMTGLFMAGQEKSADRLQRIVSIRVSMSSQDVFYILPSTGRIEATEKEAETAAFLERHGAPAVACLSDDLVSAFEIEMGEELPGVLFLVKEGERNGAAERAKGLLEQAKGKGYNIPDVIVLQTEKPLLELSESEIAAWLKMAQQKIETEKERYQHSFCADFIVEDDKMWDAGARLAIPTGFETLDNLLDGGLCPGALYALGALSSLGKTTFALQIADYIAANGVDVLYIALEQAAAELRAKSISRLTNEIDPHYGHLSVSQIMNKERRKGWNSPGIETTQKATYYDALDIYKSGIGKHIRIIEGVGNITVARIRGEVEKNIRYRKRFPVVVVDYTQILAPAAERLTDKQNVDRNIVDLKRLARDKNIPVIAICSFNRNSYFVPVEKDSFKESGSIEYSADVLLGLQPQGMQMTGKEKDDAAANKTTVQNTMHKSDRIIEAVVLKNRNGSLGTVIFKYNAVYNAYTDQGEKQKAVQGDTVNDTKTQSKKKKYGENTF